MVTNVIRQGVRDHAEFYYHQEGLGEFTDQFKMVLLNGRLTSFIIDALKNEGDNSAMKALLEKEIELTQANNKEEALTRLKAYISGSKKEELRNRYADKLAVHFAVQEVADRRYGGEKNNEIFVAFPSLYIVSQHHFNGVSLTEGTPDIASDLSVWTKDTKGMDLNAGIVFIPANQQVDRETGSKYELDQNIKPIVNEHYIQAIFRFVQSPEFIAIAKRAEQILVALSQTYIHFYDFNEQKNYQFPNRQEKDAFLQKKLRILYDEISEKFGIDDPKLQEAALDHNHLDLQLNFANKSPSEKEEFIKHCLLRHELLFKKSTQTISSKEYWTQYFLDHPEQKPSKIIFYEEQTPTEALFAWQYKNQFNLTAQNGNHSGFDENIPPLPGDITLQNIDQFEILAQRIIEQYFS